MTGVGKKCSAAMLAAAVILLALFAGAGTVHADTIVKKVNINCDVSEIGLNVENAEGTVQDKIRNIVSTDTQGVSVDPFNTFLTCYNEGPGEIWGIGDGTRMVASAVQYYCNVKLNPDSGYDWPAAVKALGSVTAVKDIPGMGVSFNGKECRDAFIGYNSAWNQAEILVPVFNSLAGGEISLSGTSFSYDGTPKMPEITSVKLSSGAEMKGNCYSIYYTDAAGKKITPVNAGTYYAAAEGKGICGGTVKKAFSIKPASAAGAAITGIRDEMYAGAAVEPQPVVSVGGTVLTPGRDYTVSYKNNTAAGTAAVLITGKGNYTGTAEKSFLIRKGSIRMAEISGVKSVKYNGKARKQSPVVKIGENVLSAGRDYRISYKNNVKAGNAVMILTGAGNYTGSLTEIFEIKKASNPLKVKGKKVSLKYSALKKKNQTVKASAAFRFVKKGQGKLKYSLASAKKGSKSFTKKFAVDAKSGKMTVKKKLAKGTYKVTVKVKAAGNADYKKSAAKKVTVSVTVK